MSQKAKVYQNTGYIIAPVMGFVGALAASGVCKAITTVASTHLGEVCANSYGVLWAALALGGIGTLTGIITPIIFKNCNSLGHALLLNPGWAFILYHINRLGIPVFSVFALFGIVVPCGIFPFLATLLGFACGRYYLNIRTSK